MAHLEELHGYALLGPQKLTIPAQRLDDNAMTPSHRQVLEEFGEGYVNDGPWLLSYTQTYASRLGEEYVKDPRLGAMVLCAQDAGGNFWAWDGEPNPGSEQTIYRIDEACSGFDDQYNPPDPVAETSLELLELWKEDAFVPFFVREQGQRRAIWLPFLTPDSVDQDNLAELKSSLEAGGYVALDSSFWRHQDGRQSGGLVVYEPAHHLLFRFSLTSDAVCSLECRYLGSDDFAATQTLMQWLNERGWLWDDARVHVSLGTLSAADVRARLQAR